MWIFSKPLEQLVKADLQALIGVRENQYLEFKQAMYHRKDPGARIELLRDTSSIGNAEGGVLIIGMAEDGEGQATKLVPVPDAQDEADRFIATCLSGIKDRIVGLRTHLVPLRRGQVIVVHIPKGYRRPYMIVADALNELWVRHDRQKARMSIDEVRSAVLATEDLEMRVDRFVEERRQHLMQSRPRPIIVAMATPLGLEQGRVDISDPMLAALLKDPPILRPNAVGIRLVHADEARVMPTVRGLAARELGRQTLEVFRNGHVEFTVEPSLRRMFSGPNPNTIVNWALAELIATFVRFVDRLREISGLADPFIVRLWLWDWPGFQMHEYVMNQFGLGNLETFDEGPDLLLPPVIHSLDDTADETAKRLLDVLWNAFHYRECPFFDQQGNFALDKK